MDTLTPLEQLRREGAKERAQCVAPAEHAARSAGAARALGNELIKEQQQVTGSPTAEDLRRRLWKLQRMMWKITAYDRLRGCHRYLAKGAGVASVQWSEQGRANFGNLQTSSSVWASPLSAASISKTRSAEVEKALKTWFELDKQHSAEFLTLTLRHNNEQTLAEVWDTISYAWRGVTATASWRGGVRMKGDKKHYGIEHWIKSVEVTHSWENGWHVHLHVVFLTGRALTDDERASLENRIYERWSRAAVRKGFDAPSRERGADLKAALKDKNPQKISAYLAKGSLASVAENLSREMSGGQATKGGREKKNRTPFQILDSLCKNFTARDKHLWEQWETGSLGRRQIAWSTGTKDALGVLDLDDEAAEAEAEGKDSPELVQVAAIPFDEWNKPRENGEKLRDDLVKRGDILEFIAGATTARKARGRARRILDAYGINYVTDEALDSPIAVYKESKEARETSRAQRHQFLINRQENRLQLEEEAREGLRRLDEATEEERAEQREWVTWLNAHGYTPNEFLSLSRYV